MKTRALTKGLLTFLPGSRHFLPTRRSSGSSSALYCYGTWMKHLTLLGEHGMTGIPRTVAELGPGASLGIGLAAILSGSSRYYALDVVRRSHVEANLTMLGNLVELFRDRTGGPVGGWPDFSAYLNRDRFPGHILTDRLLAESLSDDRLNAIGLALQNPGKSVDGITIDYMVPWSRDSVLRRESVDLALSHSVLEHVTDLNATYGALNRWLKPGALMSHQIDFTSHGLSKKWNGHRACSELTWKVVVGRQLYLINRAPYSVHRSLVLQNHFELVCEMQNFRDDGISRNKLGRHWLEITDDDLNCAGAFLQARKRCALYAEAPRRLGRERLQIDRVVSARRIGAVVGQAVGDPDQSRDRL